MLLRNRLFLSTSLPLVGLGALFATAYVAYREIVVPDLTAHLAHRAESGAAMLGAQLDVPLAAGDPAMVAETVRALAREGDLAYLEVEDAAGMTVFRQGVTADPSFPTAAPLVPRTAGAEVASWAPVSLEGIALGRVQIRFSTRRIDDIDAWARRFAVAALVMWIGALAYALRFSRAFVAPLRKMMDYSRKVASGRFTERVHSGAIGELGKLERDLNRMAEELEAQERERARAAAREQAMQQELRTMSRMAGMAEVATGVLHNVGNVLNSLNTSVSVLSSWLKGSRVAALARSVELYREHPGGLGAFLATDKGKALPQFLDKMATQLVAENAGALGELESITRNVQHIATIVSTQQTYTRTSALQEPADVRQLCDDALHMVEGSFVRHGITLIKDYQPVPTVVTDRHKVLQILINLVSNARHALDDSGRDTKQLRVSIRVDGDELVVQVADDGVGIAAANLDRIFEHGFTTKPNGHGFGLHSAANAAAELGGRLTGASPGPGQGATFTLGLPLQPAERTRNRVN